MKETIGIDSDATASKIADMNTTSDAFELREEPSDAHGRFEGRFSIDRMSSFEFKLPRKTAMFVALTPSMCM